MTRTQMILLATGGSMALLGGAFLFQLAGYPPCAMCIWQRWPHAIAILIGAIALAYQHRIMAWLGALAAFTTGGIGIYHTGVERDWWEGPTSCTSAGSGVSGLGAGDLLSTEGPKLIMCDVVSWELFGISMASWNAIFSIALGLIWVAAARKRA